MIIAIAFVAQIATATETTTTRKFGVVPSKRTLLYRSLERQRKKFPKMNAARSVNANHRSRFIIVDDHLRSLSTSTKNPSVSSTKIPTSLSTKAPSPRGAGGVVTPSPGKVKKTKNPKKTKQPKKTKNPKESSKSPKGTDNSTSSVASSFDVHSMTKITSTIIALVWFLV